MKRYGVLLFIAAVASVAYCQGSAPPPTQPASTAASGGATPPSGRATPPPSTAEVDGFEVARWGDRVSIAGEGPRAGEEVLYSKMMGTPPDDSHCWFVTLWGNSKDPATEALRKAFEKDPNLTPFVAIPEGELTPWAHFNVYYSDDGSQAHRFKVWKFVDGSGTPYVPQPVVTISPPRNGKFNFQGKPALIAKIPYGASPDGNPANAVDTPEKLKKQITGMVALYCKKLQDSGVAPRYDQYDHKSLPAPAGHTNDEDVPPPGGVGQRSSYTAPFPVPPIQQSFNPSFPFAPNPTPAPPVNPTPGAPLSFAELSALVPGAPAEFIYSQLQAGASNPQAVAAAYQIYLMQKANMPPADSSTSPSWLTTGLFGLLMAGAAWLVSSYRTKLNAQPGNQMGEQIVNLLDGLLTAFRSGSGVFVQPLRPPTPAPVSPSSPTVTVAPAAPSSSN